MACKQELLWALACLMSISSDFFLVMLLHSMLPLMQLVGNWPCKYCASLMYIYVLFH